MKFLSVTMLLTVSLFVASCGQQETNSSNSSQYKQYITSHDGIEVKEPNKVSAQQTQGNYNNVQQADILLSLDSNGTYHLRSDIPSELNGNGQELTGIRGEYDIDARGVLKLKYGGQVVAETSYSHGNLNTTSQNSFSLNFVPAVEVEVVQLSQNTGFGGTGFTSFQTVQFSLQGFSTVSR